MPWLRLHAKQLTFSKFYHRVSPGKGSFFLKPASRGSAATDTFGYFWCWLLWARVRLGTTSPGGAWEMLQTTAKKGEVFYFGTYGHEAQIANDSLRAQATSSESLPDSGRPRVPTR